ncbi:phosphoprotein [Avian metapneumovirus type D]|uniref:Phosphoprotein n=1 Tax=Avian metapneumovirus type D TaxID=519376 RepID=A0A077SG92_9MONO|nr:phosphoprotein [Avian metapneumovirus type D]
MSFPEGKDILMMGSEAAKLADAYQKSLKDPSRNSKSISGDPVATVSERVPTLPLCGPISPKGSSTKPTREASPAPKKTGPIYPKLPTAPPDPGQPEPITSNGPKKAQKKVKFDAVKPGKYSKLEEEALELLSDPDEENDKESSILTFEEKDNASTSIEARLEAIEEKLSMILGMLKTLSIATAGPTAARDGIRDAMVGMREELINSIMAEAKDKISEMIKEEDTQRAKIGDGSVRLTEKAKELNKVLEDQSSSGESDSESEDEEPEPDETADIYSLEL